MNTAVGGLSKSTSINTTATNNLSKAIGTLTSAIRTMPRGAGAAGGAPRRRGPRGFATGGLVPGTGNYDTVPAMLTPGEFVIKKSSVNSIGAGNLASMNYAAGGKVTSGRNYYGTKPTLGTSIKDPRTIPNKRKKPTKRERQIEQARVGMDDDQIALDKKNRKKFRDDKDVVGAVTISNNPLTASAIILSQIEKAIRPKIGKSSSTTSLGQGIIKGPIRDKIIDNRAGLKGGKALTPVSEGGGFGPDDPLIGNLSFRQATLDAAPAGEITKLIDFNVKAGVQQAVEAVADATQIASLGKGKGGIKSAVNKATARLDMKSIEGLVFEAITSLAIGSPAAQDANAGFDFPKVAAAAIEKLGNLFSPSLIGSRVLEAKRSATRESMARFDKGGSMVGKLLNATASLSNVKPGTLGLRARVTKPETFAKGGAVGTDTVPAMLTPGEFVINRKSAQGIGYGNLNKMNQGGGVPSGVKGFAEGGIVAEGREFYGKVNQQQIRNLATKHGISEQQAKQVIQAQQSRGRGAANKSQKMLEGFKADNAAKVAAGKNVASPKPESKAKKRPVSPSSPTGQVKPSNTNSVQAITNVKAQNEVNRQTQKKRADTRKPLKMIPLPPERAPSKINPMSDPLANVRKQSTRQTPVVNRKPTPVVNPAAPAGPAAGSTAAVNQAKVQAQAQTQAINKNTKALNKKVGGGSNMMFAAMMIPDLLFTIPMVVESLKQFSDGVEGSGGQLVSSLASVGMSAMFIAPAIKEMGGMKGALVKMKSGMAKFGKTQFHLGGAGDKIKGFSGAVKRGFGRNMAQGGNVLGGAKRGLGGGLKLLGKGSMKAGALAGAGAAAGPVIAGLIATVVADAIAAPMTEAMSTAFSGGKFENIAGIRGNKTESMSQAKMRGGLGGAFKGAVGGAVAGSAFGLTGAAAGASLGLVFGAVAGEFEAKIEKLKFNNIVGLNAAAGRAAKALGKLADDQDISTDELSAANAEVSTFLDTFAGSLGANEAINKMSKTEGIGGVKESFSQAGRFISDGFGQFSEGISETLGMLTGGFMGTTNMESQELLEKEQLRRRERGTLVESGKETRASLTAFDDDTIKNSQEGLNSVMGQLADTLGREGAKGAASIADIMGSIDLTDAKTAQQSLFAIQEELKGLGTHGEKAADRFASNLQIQFLGRMTKAADKIGGDSGEAFLGIMGKIFSNKEVFKSADALQAAQDAVREEVSGLGLEVSSVDMLRGMNDLVNSMSDIDLAAASATFANQQYLDMLKQINIQTEAIVASMTKLTNVFEQAAGSFETMVGNVGSSIDSLLSGSARFELDERVNPFENLDLNAGMLSTDAGKAEFQKRIDEGFSEINAVGGTGTAGVTSGLENAPAFAANFDQFLRDTLTEVKAKKGELGGKEPTQAEVSAIFEKQMEKGGIMANTDLGKLLLGDLEAALFSKTKSREGGTQLSSSALEKALLEDSDLMEKYNEHLKAIMSELATQVDLARKIKAQDLKILAEKRKVQIGLRDLAQKNADIDKRVGEITGTRKGTAEEADADMRARIGLITGGGNTDTASLIASQKILGDKLAQAREDERAGRGGLGISKEIGILETQLADNTDALKTVADDTSRLTAVQEKIEKLQAREASARTGALSVFQKFGEAETAMASGDVEGAQNIFKSIRKDFMIVKKLQMGAALSMSEGGRFMSGGLNDLLGSLGADPDQIEKAIDRGFKQVPRVLTNALAGIGVIIDAQTFADNLNMDELIQPLKDIAGRLGDEQKAANDAIMKEITTRASQLFDALEASQKSLNVELGEATTAVENFKKGLIASTDESGGGVGSTPAAEIARLSGSKNPETTIAGMSTGAGSNLGFSEQQLIDLQDEIKKLTEAGIEITIEDVRKARRKLINEQGFQATNEGINRLKQSRSGGLPANPNTFPQPRQGPDLRPFDYDPSDFGPGGFHEGGEVPGQGNRDSVDAKLTPGEFVFTKETTKAIGAGHLNATNKRKGKGFHEGGLVGGSAGGSGGFAAGSIEMPSYGDVIDNVDKIFQTYDDGATEMLEKRIAEMNKESDTKISSHLINLIRQQVDLKVLLHAIAKATTITSDILKAEQGPNSLQVDSTIANKNAEESSKKLTDIEKATQSTEELQALERTLLKEQKASDKLPEGIDRRPGNTDINEKFDLGLGKLNRLVSGNFDQDFVDKRSSDKSAELKAVQATLELRKMEGVLTHGGGSPDEQAQRMIDANAATRNRKKEELREQRDNEWDWKSRDEAPIVTKAYNDMNALDRVLGTMQTERQGRKMKNQRYDKLPEILADRNEQFARDEEFKAFNNSSSDSRYDMRGRLAQGPVTQGFGTEKFSERDKEGFVDPSEKDFVLKATESTEQLAKSNFELIRVSMALAASLDQGIDIDPKSITDAMVRSRIMQDASPEQRVEKVVNEMLSANMIEGGEFGGAQRASGMQAMVDQMRNDPSVGLQSDKEKLAAEVAFRDRAAREGIASGPVGMSMKEKTDRLEGRVTGFDKLTGRANVLQGRTEESLATFGGGEQAKRDAATEDRMKELKLQAGAGDNLDEIIPGLSQAVQEGRTNFGRSGATTTTGLSQGTGRATTNKDVYRDLQDLKTDRKFGRGMSDDDLTFDVLGLGGEGKTSIDVGQKEKDLKLLQANSKERMKRQDVLTKNFMKEQEVLRGRGGDPEARDWMVRKEYDRAMAEVEGSSFLGNEFMTAEKRKEFTSTGRSGGKMQEKGAAQAAFDKNADRQRAARATGTKSTEQKVAEYLNKDVSEVTDDDISKAIAQKQAEAKKVVAQKQAEAKVKKDTKPGPTGAAMDEPKDKRRLSGWEPEAGWQMTEEDADYLYSLRGANVAQIEASEGGGDRYQEAQARQTADREAIAKKYKEDREAGLFTGSHNEYFKDRDEYYEQSGIGASAPWRNTGARKPKPGKGNRMPFKDTRVVRKSDERKRPPQVPSGSKFDETMDRDRGGSWVSPQGKMFDSYGTAGQWISEEGFNKIDVPPSTYDTEPSVIQKENWERKDKEKLEKERANRAAEKKRLAALTPEQRIAEIHSSAASVGTAAGGMPGLGGGGFAGGAPAKKAPAKKPLPPKLYRAGVPGGQGKARTKEQLSGAARNAMDRGTSYVREQGSMGQYMNSRGEKKNFDDLSAGARRSILQGRSGMTKVPGTGTAKPEAGAVPGAGGAPGAGAVPGAGGAPGAGAGIMGPDAIVAMSSLAAALNGVSGGIEIKITEPVEVKLDSGSLIPKIKEIVTEAVKNSAGNALITTNNSQLDPMTASSQNV